MTIIPTTRLLPALGHVTCSCPRTGKSHVGWRDSGAKSIFLQPGAEPKEKFSLLIGKSGISSIFVLSADLAPRETKKE